jgi:hypothetical protein
LSENSCFAAQLQLYFTCLEKIIIVFFLLSLHLCENSFGQKQCNEELESLCIDELKPGFKNTICEWIGTPYNYSGDSKEGIDCSGFVAAFFKKVYNISLGDCSRDIYATDVVPLKKNSLIPSDLVFFRIQKKSISHVGIYLGNNKFVHATTKQGVIISDLNEPYYRKYFYKAGRVKELPSSN